MMITLEDRRHELTAKLINVDRAIQANKAWEWLEEFGPPARQLGNNDLIANITLNYGGAVPGVKEAKELLEATIYKMWPEIVARAIEEAKETIRAAEE